MQLSKFERLVLANQLRMLETMFPAEAEYYANHRTALEEGYVLHYEWLFEHIDEELPKDDCQFVIEVLNMHRSMHFAFKDISETSLSLTDVRFKGFDGNEETRHFAYARYFIEDLGRFQELAEQQPHADFNSHRPMTGTYRRMLKAWHESEDRFELDAADVQRILNARNGQ